MRGCWGRGEDCMASSAQQPWSLLRMLFRVQGFGVEGPGVEGLGV